MREHAGRRTSGRAVRALTAVAVVLVCSGCARSWVGRVNVATDGTQADHATFTGAVLSADGRYAAFASSATTLVPADTNGANDVFVRDNRTGATERISVASDESQADEPVVAGSDAFVDISPDGRFVVFGASFSDLVPGPRGPNDVYLRDRVAGTTERVSLSDDDAVANGATHAVGVSADGRFVAFTSSASNLVDGDTNGDPPCTHVDQTCELAGSDVFVRDRVAGSTERLSVTHDGSQAEDTSGQFFFSPLNTGADISDDGRYVTFESRAPGLVAGEPDIDADTDVFVRDRIGGTIELVSVGLDGAQANGESFASDTSPDGRYVTFMSTATNLAVDPPDQFRRRHIFLRDRTTGTTERVSEATDGAVGDREPDPGSAVSADGRFVVFASFADDLVPGDTNGGTDIFLRDRSLGTLERVSRAHDGREPADTAPPAALASSTVPELSDDGRYVSFSSQADNLVPDDTNGLVTDVFVRYALGPVIASAAPAGLGPGVSEVTVSGARFVPGVAAYVSGEGVEVLAASRIDEDTLRLDISVAPSAPPGTRLLTVVDPGTGPGAGRGGFDVCACITIG